MLAATRGERAIEALIAGRITPPPRRREAATRLGAILPWQPSEAAIQAALADLATVQRRSRQRTLGESDVW